jgi:two-component system sensor histidine kinase ChvG
MAIQAERGKERSRLWSDILSAGRGIGTWTLETLAIGGGLLAAIVRAAIDRFTRIPLWRLVTRTLLRRIIVSNMVGLVILLAGYAYLSQYKDALIAAKRDSLLAQAEIIAAAVAANAAVQSEGIVLDPDKLPDIEGALIPFRDDAFAALELSISPEKVTPVLRRLMQDKPVRGRVYDREGKLLVDINPREKPISKTAAADDERPKTKNLWTRLTEYFFSSDIPVYKEIGSANGLYYPSVRAAMTGTPSAMLMLDTTNDLIVAVATPIKRMRQVQGVVLLSTNPGDIDAALDKEQWALFKVALLALAATMATSILLAQTVAGPMRQLSAAAEQVSHNIKARQKLPDLSNRADEIGQMSAAFTAMTASLYRRIEASEKFAADVAHELKNPLTAARSTAESLSYARTAEQRDQLVTQIQSELKRLNRLITDVSNASRLEAELALQESEPVAMGQVLAGIVATFQDIHRGEGLKIVLEVEGGVDGGSLVVNGHEGRLGQVVTNLIDNALSFSPQNGTVTVRARRVGAWIEVIVEDEGPGIEPDKLETIFDRFYTYRPDAFSSRGNNSGLGLSISREIARAHGGDIRAENRYRAGDRPPQPPAGARFIVRLPLTRETSQIWPMRGWRG